MPNETTMIVAIILFVITYLALFIFTDKRAYIALISAALFVIIGIVPLDSIFAAVDWNVIMMLFGIMGVVGLFIESKMPAYIADVLLKRLPNAKWALVFLAIFAGVVSAFIDNVATVLIVAPIGMVICKKMDISPVSAIIAIAVSSNLQGAATLVGDTTSIMLGGFANLNFFDFFFTQGKMSIFFAVELGALATIPFLLFMFRNHTDRVEFETTTKVQSYYPTFLLLGILACLIGASLIEVKPDVTNGLICMFFLIVGLIITAVKSKSFKAMEKVVKEIDYTTMLLLIGLFIVIKGIENAGIIAAIGQFFVDVGGDNVFLIYSMIVWFSVLFSAFIDNIPYVATMLPIVTGIASAVSCNPLLLYFGLLTGATLGGNITPVGASANITGIGILKKEGYQVKTKDFVKIGLPFTLIATLAGYIFNWIVWGI